MATTISEIPDRLLEEIALQVYTDYGYLSVGTGVTPITTTSVQLGSPVAITTPSFNKAQESNSVLTGRSFLKFFTINSGEPVSQPVNIGEAGLVNSSTNTPNLGIGAVLNVAQTKDNKVQHKWRVSARINRQGE